MVITHISYSLYASSIKVQTLASELLAAICFLSVNEGHKSVLAAMSDFRVAFDESFRFESLIATLRLPELAASDTESDGEGSYGLGYEREGVWEARTSAMTLINALTNCPESLEERILLREELGRRGLNETIVASCLSLALPSLISGRMLILVCLGFEICETTRCVVHTTRCLY